MGRSIRFFVCVLLVMATTVAGAAGQSPGDAAQLKEEKKEPHGASAVTKEVPHRSRRRQVLQARPNRQPAVPVERRWELIWPTPDRRVSLTWPPATTYRLSWDDQSETPLGAPR
jgi:hypothetical protein